MSNYLDYRNIVVGRSEGQQLLQRAGEPGAELLVAGAWGHSRMREFVLGGVTLSLLDRMTLPVPMSH